MLFIKSIYLPLSHLPTSHTTVRAVRHTAVSCFYTLPCVASCFQPSLRDTSLLYYCRIPSYRMNRAFLFGHLTTKDSQGNSHWLLHCTIQFFPIDTRTSNTMTSDDFSRQALLRHGTSITSSSPCVPETSSDKNIIFPSYTYLIFSQNSRKIHLSFRIAIGLWFVLQSNPWFICVVWSFCLLG